MITINTDEAVNYKVLGKAAELGKGYTDESMAKVAGAAAAAIAEKQDKISSKTATLTASGWKKDNDEYPCYYDIPDVTVTASDRADVTALVDDSTADSCKFCCRTATGAGYIRIRAKTAPTANISVEYQII